MPRLMLLVHRLLQNNGREYPTSNILLLAYHCTADTNLLVAALSYSGMRLSCAMSNLCSAVRCLSCTKTTVCKTLSARPILPINRASMPTFDHTYRMSTTSLEDSCDLLHFDVSKAR